MSRRLALALALVLLLAPAAARAQLALDPGPNADNSAAIQAALDATPAGRNLVLPAGRYRLDRTVWHNRAGVGLVGDPGGTTLWGPTNRHLLALGFDRAFALGAWSPVALDASLPGTRYGLDLSKASLLLIGTTVEHGAPADTIPTPTFWASARKLTVAAILVPTGGVGSGGSVLLDTPQLAAFALSNGTVTWILRTADGQRWYVGPSGWSKGQPLRYAAVADLDAGTFAVYRDGQPVKLTPRAGDKPMAPGLAFRDERGVEPWVGSGVFNGSPTNAVLAAMRWTADALPPTPGVPDSWYCSRSGSTDLALLEPPRAPAAAWEFASTGLANLNQEAVIVPVDFASSTKYGLLDVAVRDLSLQPNNGYGSGLLLGSVRGLRVERVNFHGGASGLAQVNCMTSYPLDVAGCTAEWASFAAFRFGYGIVNARDLRIESTGRHAMTGLGGFGVEGLFVAEGSITTEVIRTYGAVEGTRLVVDRAVINYEAFQPERLIRVSRGQSWATLGPHVVLRDVIANNSRKTPVLVEGTPGGPRTIVELDGFGRGLYGVSALLEVTGDPADVHVLSAVPGLPVPAATLPVPAPPPPPPADPKLPPGTPPAAADAPGSTPPATLSPGANP